MTVGFATRPCVGCGCSVSALAGFSSVAVCSYCGAGPDAYDVVSAALADASVKKHMDPTEHTPEPTDVREPVRTSSSTQRTLYSFGRVTEERGSPFR